jgi:hypothetical protein
MRKGTARRCRHGLRRQPRRTRNVCRSGISEFIERAARERIGQPSLRLGGLRIDRQRAIKVANHLSVIVTVKR